MLRKIALKLLHFIKKKEILDRQYAIGFTSHINKGSSNEMHMLFLDYDDMNFSEVLADCSELASFWNLSDFEIYETEAKNYHAFFWYDNSLPYSRVKMILEYSRCDNMFKYISRYYDKKTIRVGGKYRDDGIGIKWIGRFAGSRTATHAEREIGNLKKREYDSLKKLDILADKVLKK